MDTETTSPAATLPTQPNRSNSFQIGPLLRQAWAFNWPLTLTGLMQLLLIPLIVVAMVVDPKTITDAPAWIKPLKFAISSSIYGFTFI